MDIAVGFDITRMPNRPLFSGQVQLKQQLPKIISKIASLDNICCVPNSIIKPKFAFSLVDKEGRELDYFPFEEYSSGVVGKVTDLVANRNTFFNTQLLESFQKVFRNSAAKVKVNMNISTFWMIYYIILYYIILHYIIIYYAILYYVMLCCIMLYLCFMFQVLVIFSDGLDEPVKTLELESDRLRSSGRILKDL